MLPPDGVLTTRTKVVLRNLPPHRARHEGKEATITDGLDTRRHRLWVTEQQTNMIGYVVEIDNPLGWNAEFRVPAVCVYPKEG